MTVAHLAVLDRRHAVALGNCAGRERVARGVLGTKTETETIHRALELVADEAGNGSPPSAATCAGMSGTARKPGRRQSGTVRR